MLALLAGLIASCGGPPAPPSLAVGATPDPESLVLAHVYAGALRSTGATVDVETAADPVAELDSGSVNVVPGFTGRLLRTFAPDAIMRSDKQVYRAMVAALPEGIAAGDYATAAQDKPALAVTAATAKTWGSDLTAVPRHCRGLAVGLVPGDPTPTAVGACRLPAAREFPDAAALFAGLQKGQVTVAWTSTAAPDVPADLVVLADSKSAQVQAENVVPLYRRNELTERQLLAINEVAGVLDTAALVDMRRQVSDGADPWAVADAWLAEHPLGR
ncbi:MAG TPA: glycine betaine ABC transporter substrate-binding protein [Mycobacterium sp.]|nr:glycine betaine ABC transporter substrate-binding protein [Mycobacterium sp.]